MAAVDAVVLGLGRSGAAAARLLRREGATVTVLEREASEPARTRASEVEALGASVTFGAEASLPPCALCVVSPGVPVESPWVRAAQAAAAEVVSELEFGWRRFPGRTIAITGSNGKSTCTRLCAEAVSTGGLRALPAGNYGTPVSEIMLGDEVPDVLVLEVSTFQLETCVAFAPDVGVLLNLLPNHLDRHGTMSVYGELKFRLFRGLRGRAVVASALRDDAARAAKCTAEWVTFGAEAGSDYRYESQMVRTPAGTAISLADTHFGNPVLGLAAAAAAAAVEGIGLEAACVAAAAGVFEPLPHRMEKIGTWRGIAVVDDSKATNLAALAAALQMTQGKVHLIAGGILKEQEVRTIKKLLASTVSGAYLVGEAMSTLADAWGDVIPVHACGNMETAVSAACRAARAGETVLLSPACASFDQYDGYAQRGQVFQSLVHSVMEGMEA